MDHMRSEVQTRMLGARLHRSCRALGPYTHTRAEERAVHIRGDGNERESWKRCTDGLTLPYARG